MTKHDVFVKAKGRLLRTAIALKTFWLRYKRNRGATFGLIVITILTITAVFADVIAPYGPMEMHLDSEWIFREPSMANFLGTDNFGRDIYSRIIFGTRVSLTLGLIAAVVAGIIGVLAGSLAGYFGGIIDELFMRLVDIFLSLPDFFLILLMLALFGRNILNMIAVIALILWPSTARLIRSEVLSAKNSEYTIAAKSVGATDMHIIFREILPNVIHTAIVNVFLSISWAILLEASVTFLGLGDPNVPSWGWILNNSLGYFLSAWWTSTFPGLAIALTVISFNLVGDGLNDALNPRLRRR